MSDAAIKERPTNDMGYYEMDASKFKPLGDRILVQWQHQVDELTVGKIKLLTPELTKKMKYTGVVLSYGNIVALDYPEIQPGVRILFDQFSNFEKFFDKELGRLALISASQQASAFAIIPDRAKIGEGESDFNYEK